MTCQNTPTTPHRTPLSPSNLPEAWALNTLLTELLQGKPVFLYFKLSILEVGWVLQVAPPPTPCTRQVGLTVTTVLSPPGSFAPFFIFSKFSCSQFSAGRLANVCWWVSFGSLIPRGRNWSVLFFCPRPITSAPSPCPAHRWSCCPPGSALTLRSVVVRQQYVSSSWRNSIVCDPGFAVETTFIWRHLSFSTSCLVFGLIWGNENFDFFLASQWGPWQFLNQLCYPQSIFSPQIVRFISTNICALSVNILWCLICFIPILWPVSGLSDTTQIFLLHKNQSLGKKANMTSIYNPNCTRVCWDISFFRIQ